MKKYLKKQYPLLVDQIENINHYKKNIIKRYRVKTISNKQTVLVPECYFLL